MGIVIGVDIGTKEIKLAAVEYKKTVDVKWTDVIVMPEKCLYDGEIIDHETIMYTLADYFSKYKILKTPVAVTVSSSHMGTKAFELPMVKSNMIDKAVQLDFFNQFGYSLEEYSVSYKLSGKTKTNLWGIMAYCPKKYIEDMKELFNKSDLNLKYIDMNANSFSKFYKHLVIKEAVDEAVLLLDIGTDTSHMAIVASNTLKMSRSVINGGNDLDQIVAEYLDISLEEASALKHDKYKSVYEAGKDLELQIQMAYSSLMREIEYTIAKFQETSGIHINRILLLGGGSNLPGFSSHLKQAFKKPTQLLSGANIKNCFLNEAHIFAGAIGAAIRED